MTEVITPTTELDAVNMLLATIQTAPINSLEGDLTADVALARNTLSEVSNEVQLPGWHFNTEYNYPLNRNVDGFINIPDNITKIVLDRAVYWPLDVVQRGSRLYDRYNHTFVFTVNLKVEVTLRLPFDELIEAARHYIAIRAARRFQDRTVGSEEGHRFTENDEYIAKSILDQVEAETAARSIFDSYGVADVLNR